MIVLGGVGTSFLSKQLLTEGTFIRIYNSFVEKGKWEAESMDPKNKNNQTSNETKNLEREISESSTEAANAEYAHKLKREPI